ncbi:MAG: 2-polyprenyl-3-methyl-6-methoxy-1,4-benzoquinone monooxygenase [Pseudomonadota bacterium]
MTSSTLPLRRLSGLDRLLDQADRALRTTFARPALVEDSPAVGVDEQPLEDADRRHASGLMRINHTGEVCAQALYEGQALVARKPEVAAHLLEAAAEETRHLAWCDARLRELNSRPSRLNGLWYAGSFALGSAAGLAGDQWSLAFVVETERQVEAHLADHLDELPAGDQRSRAIVTQMMEDEARHGREAAEAGAAELPGWIRAAMAGTASVMKVLAYRF